MENKAAKLRIKVTVHLCSCVRLFLSVHLSLAPAYIPVTVEAQRPLTLGGRVCFCYCYEFKELRSW